MKSFSHYYAAAMAIFALIGLALLWCIALDFLSPRQFMRMILAPGMTLAFVVFAFGCFLLALGKIDI